MRVCILEHFKRYLGEPLRRIEFPETTVCLWPDRDDQRRQILMTCGMAERPQKALEGRSLRPNPRTELIIHGKSEDAEILAQTLADLALYPKKNDTFFHWFHTLPLGRPIVPNSRLDGVLFSFPIMGDADFYTFKCDGQRIDVLQVVPISPQERELAREKGAQFLDELLEKKYTPISDMLRASIV